MNWDQMTTYLILVLFVGPTALLIIMLLAKGMGEIWKLFDAENLATGELSLERNEAVEGDLIRADTIVAARCSDSSLLTSSPGSTLA